MQALFHDKHPLAFTSVVCVLGCLFPFSGKCIFSIAFLGIAGIAPNFQDESPVSTEKKGTEPHIPICTKQEHGHFDIDGEPLEFGYLRIHGMG